MDKILEQRRGTFMWALSLSIGFPVGILMIIFGFIKGGGFIAMAVVGIILAAVGFYVMPLVWVHFGTLCYYVSVANQIINDRIRSVKMLSELHNKDQKTMAFDVKKMVQKNYLPGYVVLDNEKIVDTRAMKDRDYAALEAERSGGLNLVHCPFCNAKFEMILDVEECPYCKSKITKEMIDKSVNAYNKEGSENEKPADNTTGKKK